MSSSQTLAKAVKVEWQNRVASLYWRVLGELHLLGRWIPVEELALVGLDFLPMFKTRFVEQAFRGSLIGGTEAGLDFVFVSAKYNCANSPEGTFARFAQRPRRWVYVTHCAAGGEVGVPVPAAPRHLIEYHWPAAPERHRCADGADRGRSGEAPNNHQPAQADRRLSRAAAVCDFAALFQKSHG
jgi:hypothetical protein